MLNDTTMFLFLSTLDFSPSYSSPSPAYPPSSSPTPVGLGGTQGRHAGQAVGAAGGRFRVLEAVEAAGPDQGGDAHGHDGGGERGRWRPPRARA